MGEVHINLLQRTPSQSNHVFSKATIPLPISSASPRNGIRRERSPRSRPAVEVGETPFCTLQQLAQNTSAAKERECGVRISRSPDVGHRDVHPEGQIIISFARTREVVTGPLSQPATSSYRTCPQRIIGKLTNFNQIAKDLRMRHGWLG